MLEIIIIIEKKWQNCAKTIFVETIEVFRKRLQTSFYFYPLFCLFSLHRAVCLFLFIFFFWGGWSSFHLRLHSIQTVRHFTVFILTKLSLNKYVGLYGSTWSGRSFSDLSGSLCWCVVWQAISFFIVCLYSRIQINIFFLTPFSFRLRWNMTLQELKPGLNFHDKMKQTYISSHVEKQ